MVSVKREAHISVNMGLSKIVLVGTECLAISCVLMVLKMIFHV
jgi:hypothetical protein